MAGSLENRGKLRELIDKFQFVRNRNFEVVREIRYKFICLMENRRN